MVNMATAVAPVKHFWQKQHIGKREKLWEKRLVVVDTSRAP
jgi:hypothetical protein